MLTSKKNKRIPVAHSLADELITTVFHKRSDSLKRKVDLYHEVVKNRAYAHFR